MIDRLRRLFLGDVRVEAREVEGPAWPDETRVMEDLEDVRFEPATPNVWLDHVTMRQVDFSGLRFLRLYAADCRFIGCDFSRVRVDWLPFASGGLSGVVFNGRDDTDRRENEFRGNDFREADLDDVAFRFGIDLDAQRLPEGPEYVRLRNIVACIKIVRADVMDSPEAVQMLDLVEDIYADEEDVITKRSFLVDLADSPEVGERVVDLLVQASSTESQDD